MLKFVDETRSKSPVQSYFAAVVHLVLPSYYSHLQPSKTASKNSTITHGVNFPGFYTVTV